MGVKATKLDSVSFTRRYAARSQIETAIELFLRRSDPVSAHVLAWSAVEMMRGVAMARNIPTFHEQLEDWIKPEGLKFWRDRLKTHYNYAKHADRDPERIVDDFKPEFTGNILFAACFDYNLLYLQRTWRMTVMQSWFFCRNPKFAKEPLLSALPAIAEEMGNPVGERFRESTTGAVEIMKVGLKNFDFLLERSGQSWLKDLER